ncbi:MAG: T9SS type B sorting domain-containing protein [Sphingobacteriales bacterium]|nr:MAG: T9SS type B sorting domain-containing protein [Sphingobacteriales bacterium]
MRNPKAPYRFVFLLIALLLWRAGSLYASHIVGGEMTYRCIGGNNYEIRLDIYQDCLTGHGAARADDDPAFIGVFNLDGGPPSLDSVRSTSSTVVPPNFSNSCVNNPPPTCLTKLTFIFTRTLRPNNSGYRIMYIRCCRNESVNNIMFPNTTGATYFCDIPPNTCNNSAVYKNFPPQIICVNNPLVYDHSASDPDGDSLSYSFCQSFEGGSNQDAKPWPLSTNPGLVRYMPGFSASRPIAGNPTIQINPATGMISGTPNLLGRYVVTVCCDEWRGGKVINTVKREFQFVVTNCSKAVVANIPQFSEEFNTYVVQCNSLQVGFVNQSTGGFAYDWSFGVAGAASTDFQPTYTYPDTGTYVVKLVVNPGSTCPDSISRIVKVYPTHTTDYEFSGLKCPRSEISFTDKSDASFKPIDGWYWNFGDNTESSEQHPKHAWNVGGDYNVMLVSKNVKGCRDTATKVVSIERFVPFAGNDTIIVKGEIINFNATGGNYYVWTPSTGLNFRERNNPTGFYPDTGRYSYNVHISTVTGCEGNDSIKVWVVGQPSLWVPTAFTPNGDGKNDKLRPISVGYANIKYFRVFNRFGEMVYETKTFFDGWDGWFKGETADLGTYFWVLSVTNRFGKDELIKGDAILIR